MWFDTSMQKRDIRMRHPVTGYSDDRDRWVQIGIVAHRVVLVARAAALDRDTQDLSANGRAHPEECETTANPAPRIGVVSPGRSRI